MKELINQCSRFFYQKSLGLLLLRIGTGYIFLTHGWMKIHNIAMVSGMMTHLGVVMPEFFGPFIAWLEVIGGIMLILGVLTRFFGAVFGIEMLFAIFLTGFSRGLGAHDLEIILMLSSFAIALIGSGRFSLYKMECAHCGGMLCDGKKCSPKSER